MRYDISNHLNHIGNTLLERIGNDCNEQSTKFRGMHIDENSTWKRHISEVTKKCPEHYSQLNRLNMCFLYRLSENVIFCICTPMLWYYSMIKYRHEYN